MLEPDFGRRLPKYYLEELIEKAAFEFADLPTVRGKKSKKLTDGFVRKAEEEMNSFNLSFTICATLSLAYDEQIKILNLPTEEARLRALYRLLD